MTPRRYTFKEPATALAARFTQAKKDNVAAALLAARLRKYAGLSLLLTIPGSIYAGAKFFERFPDDPIVVLIAIAAGVLIPFLTLQITAGVKGRHDVDDRKLDVAITLLRFLSADVPSTQPVDLTIDFNGIEDGGEILEKDGGMFSSRTKIRYAHLWLQVRCPLADGSVLDLRNTDALRRKEKSKRRGVKRDDRLRGHGSIALRLAKAYGPAEPIADGLKKIPRPAGCLLGNLTGKGRTLHATFTSDHKADRRGGKLLDADGLLKMMRWMYRGIAAARRTAA